MKAITKEDARTHTAHTIPGMPIKHLQPVKAGEPGQFAIKEPVTGKVVERDFTAGILDGGGFMVAFEPAEGDDTPGGWDRYILDFNDVINLVAAEVLRERALMLRIAKTLRRNARMYRCGHQNAGLIRDDFGRPVPGVSDLQGMLVKLYLVEESDGAAWTYVLSLPDGSISSVVWPAPPAVPRWKWVG
jgi:heme exporter protein D